MSVRKKRCRVCLDWYRPDPRTRGIQKACGKPACRRERKRLADAGWRAKNKDYDAARRGKKCSWAAAYPDYWKIYRASHPDYVQRNREHTRERRKASRRMFANQDAIGRDPVGFLEGLRPEGMFANQDAMRRPIDGILTFLVQKEAFANHDVIDPAPLAMASS